MLNPGLARPTLPFEMFEDMAMSFNGSEPGLQVRLATIK